jgi:hypothetical protein
VFIARDNSGVRWQLIRFCLLVLTFTLGLIPCYGQIVNASLFGTVADTSGAVVPDATVAVREQSTSFTAKSTTDSTGSYILLSLRPGVYDVTVGKAGFKTSVISGIALLVDQKAQLDLQLQVGDVATRVDVVGVSPIVDTSTASIGSVIGEKDVTDLPLNLRRFGALAVLVPGTVPDNGGFASEALGSPFSETTYSAGGLRSTSNNYLIDGVDSRGMNWGGFQLQPPPDAVQEFKIQTNVYSAAFGKTAGSTVNLVTRSGSNGLHGSVYEFLRNDMLDARNFFATTQPKYRRNQYGAGVGGPIRKNKTFFFVNYEGLRQVQGNTRLGVIPTPTELTGDLSSSLTGQTVNLCGTGGPANLNFDSGQLFAPASLQQVTCPVGSANAGSTILVGNPIPGNIITNIDPVAQKVLASYPSPNRTGAANFVNNIPNTRFDSLGDGRLDEVIGPKDQLFARYLFGQSSIVQPGPTAVPGFQDTIYFRGQNFALGWTHTFGPHLLSEARFGYQRDYDILNCASCPRTPGFMASFGINGLQAAAPSTEAYPLFEFTNYSYIGDNDYRPTINPDTVEKYQENLTWTRGRHTVVVGVDLEPVQFLHQQSQNGTHGTVTYNGQFSGLAGELPGVATVSDLADFLQGYPSNAVRNFRFQPVNDVGGGFFNFYGQDDIQVRRNISVNLGLRWEYRRQWVDNNNNIVTFVPTGPKFSGSGNAILVTAADNSLNDSFCTNPAYSYLISASGQCLVASSARRAQLGFTGRTGRTLVFPNYKDFAPRLGISWRPTSSDKLIIRTGFGIFYDLGNHTTEDFVGQNPIFSPDENYSTAFGVPPPLTNGVPTTVENVFGSGAAIPNLSALLGYYGVDPHMKSPMIKEYSFGIESQLAKNLGLEVGYVGNKGTRLSNLHLFGNQPNPGLGPLQPRRPYPDFGLIANATGDAISNYNSLQVKLTQRLSAGVSFLVAYTFAKSLDDAEGDEGFVGGVGNVNAQDDNNVRASYGRSYNDVRHRLVASYTWDLPVGKGKRFLNQSGFVDAALGGWEISGITSWQSGYPFTVTIGNDYPNTGSLVETPDRLCNGTGRKTISDWFNLSCFTVAPLQAALAAGNPRFGNSGRNILDAPGFYDWDLNFSKHFKLNEHFQLEFRGEMYNAFNHPNFGNPSANIQASTAGQILSAATPRDIQFGLKLLF